MRRSGRELQYHCHTPLVRTHSRRSIVKYRLDGRVGWFAASIFVDGKTGPEIGLSVIFFAGHNEYSSVLDIGASFRFHAAINIAEWVTKINSFNLVKAKV